jgi:S1-C subfamily serine protease
MVATMSNTLTQLSQELASLVENSAPSLVRVEARKRLPATGIVWSAEGLILTSNHVVEMDKGIRVGLHGGTIHEAELVGRDPSTDIALLRVKGAATLHVPTWGLPHELGVGNLVLALGRPGENVLATLGVVSALEGEWAMRGGAKIEHYLQTDVVMYPGFSGGALVGAEGKFYGMNSSTLMQGVSLTLTPPTLLRVVGALAQHGRIRRGYLGVGLQPVVLPAALAEANQQKRGLMVVSLENDSPADKGGLVMGDILLKVDGQAVQDVEDLLGMLVGERVGKALNVYLIRGGEARNLSVTVGER